MPRAAAAGAKKGPKNTKLAEEFPNGTEITDILKKQWKLGSVIGQGGFGLVYLANSADCSTTTSKNAQYVIKIEPGGNGPLFCEMNFYIRAAKKVFIDEFIRSHRLKYLAVPPYIGSGMHTYNSMSYRFLVMPRYGTDLQKLLQAAGGKFACATVFAIGMRMVDALQYLHEKEYVHADVKASNILLGYDGNKENKNQVYLADYGLAYRYTADNKHKDYKIDPRNAHNGTIEFTSRDAHTGVFPSRRGDLEILGFCLLQWLCGKLPWESKLTDPTFVAGKKAECMSDVDSFVKACFSLSSTSQIKSTPPAECIQQYMHEVNRLEYQEEPNYRKFKDLLRSGLNKAGQKDEWLIQHPTETQSKKRKSQGTESPRPSPKKKSKTIDHASAKVMSKYPKTETSKSPLKKRTLVANGKEKATKSPSVSKGTSPKIAKTTPARKTFDSSKPLKKYQIPPPSTRSPRKSPQDKYQIPPPSRISPRKSLLDKYQIPPPSKTSPRKCPAIPRSKTAAATKTVRRVRRVNVSSTDASIQTTPGLKTNV